VPQLRLDYTTNIIEKNNFASLFEKCHKILADNLPTKIESCKSRAVEQEDYYIGNGDSENAFICVQLQVMSGRPKDVLNFVAENILAEFKNHFSKSLAQRKLQITLEMIELSEEMYFKIKS
jgi:5-carboxymethyl-2-hydroxymuconate isomerase